MLFRSGFEFYTGQEGVIAVNAFRKSITGFTTNNVVTQPFSYLAQYGITYDTLNDTQKTAINSRGGPTGAQAGSRWRDLATGHTHAGLAVVAPADRADTAQAVA